MEKTNTGLVKYAKDALAEGWGYVWGTYGRVLTEEYLAAKIKQYPVEVGQKENIIRKWIGKKTADCIGLAKGYMWTNDAGKIVYTSSTDFGANGMYQQAKKKGKIAALPETPGLMLYFSGHAGVYIGNGNVIEARGSNYGVVQTKISQRPWTDWYEIPFINYQSAAPETYVVVTTINGYISSSDAQNHTNPRVRVTPGTYYVFNKSGGMLNLTTVVGSPGSWINPADNKIPDEPDTVSKEEYDRVVTENDQLKNQNTQLQEKIDDAIQILDA